MDFYCLLYVDEVIYWVIDYKEILGVVFVVICYGKMVYFKVYGNKWIYFNVELMEINIVFDMVFCSKFMLIVVLVMILVEWG